MIAGALAGLRVIEMCDEIGTYCGRLLADLGADVIKVEPPAGSRERRMPPFHRDEPGAERSLLFWIRNCSKRSVVLDLETAEGRADLLRLVASADAVIDDHLPGALTQLGLSSGALRAANPALVHTSMTGWGQDGPHASYAYADIVGQAMAGVMVLAGYPDEPPNLIYGDQANVCASILGAVATVAALRHVESGGEGQDIDVSAQEALSYGQEAAIPMWDLQQKALIRTGRLGPVILDLPGYGLYRCAEGYVFIMVLGMTGEPFTSLVAWMRDLGLQEDLDDGPWPAFCAGIGMEALNPMFGDPAAAAAVAPQLAHVQSVVQRFFLSMTAEQAFVEGSERRMIIGVVSEPKDVARNTQLRARGWFVPLDTPDGGKADFPGPPYRLNASPVAMRRPPRLGEHTSEVLAALPPAREKAPAHPAHTPRRRLPLEGVRVADFTWFGVGPLASRPLALLGAEVIKVESESKVDGMRKTHPFARNADGSYKLGYNVSGYYNNFNPGKRSLQLNLNAEQGLEIAYRLVEASDILVTNFSATAVDRWGLRYEQLRAVNSSIIAAYAPMQGLEGPYRHFLGLGSILVPLVGLSYMTGFAGRPPAGLGTSYPDYTINPGHMTLGILAALRHRDRTGEGQLVEVAQLESTANAMGTAILEHLANGANPGRAGNRRAHASPHGAFPCLDDATAAGDVRRWVAIACRDDRDWAALCAAFGVPQVAAEPRFRTLAARRANEDALEDVVSRLTRERRAEEVMALLQAHGVPGGVVQTAQDILDRDPHVAARGYYEYLDHPETGRAVYDGAFARFSATPLHHRAPAPLMGADTFDVCTDVLGLTPDEIAELQLAGTLT